MLKKSGKDAFSLMEVIISVVILSVVMITLLQIKSDNIFLVSKSEEKNRTNDYILMALSFNEQISNKNESVLIDRKFAYENEEIKEELKNKKINIQDDELESKTIESNRNSINITTLFRSFSLENSDTQKKIYTFKIEL